MSLDNFRRVRRYSRKLEKIKIKTGGVNKIHAITTETQQSPTCVRDMRTENDASTGLPNASSTSLFACDTLAAFAIRSCLIIIHSCLVIVGMRLFLGSTNDSYSACRAQLRYSGIRTTLNRSAITTLDDNCTPNCPCARSYCGAFATFQPAGEYVKTEVDGTLMDTLVRSATFNVARSNNHVSPLTNMSTVADQTSRARARRLACFNARALAVRSSVGDKLILQQNACKFTNLPRSVESTSNSDKISGMCLAVEVDTYRLIVPLEMRFADMRINPPPRNHLSASRESHGHGGTTRNGGLMGVRRFPGNQG